MTYLEAQKQAVYQWGIVKRIAQYMDEFRGTDREAALETDMEYHMRKAIHYGQIAYEAEYMPTFGVE